MLNLKKPEKKKPTPGIKSIYNFVDVRGFIGHGLPGKPFDFGDSTQRCGMVGIAEFAKVKAGLKKALPGFNDGWLKILDLIFRETVDHNGAPAYQYARHWDDRKWWGQLWIMSRDNLEPLLFCTALHALENPQVKKHFKQMLKLIWKRRGFMWNYRHIHPKPDDEPKIPDWFPVWDLLAHAIRGLEHKRLYPLLVILDMTRIITSIIRVVESRRKPTETSDDLNHIAWLVFAQLTKETPTAWIAKLIYRMRATAKYKFGDTNKMIGQLLKLEKMPKECGALTALRIYIGSDDAPPIDDIYKEIIEHYL